MEWREEKCDQIVWWRRQNALPHYSAKPVDTAQVNQSWCGCELVLSALLWRLASVQGGGCCVVYYKNDGMTMLFAKIERGSRLYGVAGQDLDQEWGSL